MRKIFGRKRRQQQNDRERCIMRHFIILRSTKYYWDGEIKEHQIGRTCCMHGRDKQGKNFHFLNMSSHKNFRIIYRIMTYNLNFSRSTCWYSYDKELACEQAYKVALRNSPSQADLQCFMQHGQLIQLALKKYARAGITTQLNGILL